MRDGIRTPENPHEYKKKPPIGLISGFSCLVETEGLEPIENV